MTECPLTPATQIEFDARARSKRARDLVIEIWVSEFMQRQDIELNNGRYSVSGNVSMRGLMLDCIPVKFGHISGDFDCSCNRLKSLVNAPDYVGGSFNCSSNRITTLEGGPREVAGTWHGYDNCLRSLIGAPVKVGSDFNVSFNNLVSLDGIPKVIGGRFTCKQAQLGPKETIEATIRKLSSVGSIRILDI